MSDCKPKPTPCILGTEKVSNEKSPELTDPRLYRAMVGSLIYIMTGKRPDLCYVVKKSSQKMSKPTQADLSTAKHVLRYLKGTQELGLTFRKSCSPLIQPFLVTTKKRYNETAIQKPEPGTGTWNHA
jgi:hypothetical protein